MPRRNLRSRTTLAHCESGFAVGGVTGGRLRHDLASADYFNSDSGLKQHRTTITFAQIVRF